MTTPSMSYACEQFGGRHEFPEVLVTEDDEPPGALRKGMCVVVPCTTCGMTPLEQMNGLGEVAAEAQRALNLLLISKAVPLFHWSPAARRGQIMRHGLRPAMRPTTSSADLGDWRAPYVCLGDSPRWAWGLSGGQRGTPDGEWDLWETAVGMLTDPEVLASAEGRGLHEVRVSHRIPKRDLWLAGHRWKGER